MRILVQSWKARLQAYGELSRKFRMADTPRDTVFRDFYDSMKQCPLEANAVAQEAAMGCMVAYFECCDGSLGKRLRGEVTGAAIEKGLGAVRTGTRTKTVELLMILIELDVAEPILHDLLSFLTHKQPKLVAAVVNCITETVR